MHAEQTMITYHKGVVFVSRPDPFELFGSKDGRFLVPAMPVQISFAHRFRGLSVPIGAYLDEICVCLQGAKISERFEREHVVRKTVERTLRMKFRQGRRGFRQWLLKHQSWTRMAKDGDIYFRKHQRRKIKEPTIHFNPAVKIGFVGGGGISFRGCKRNGLRPGKVKGGGANNGSRL